MSNYRLRTATQFLTPLIAQREWGVNLKDQPPYYSYARAAYPAATTERVGVPKRYFEEVSPEAFVR